jgi:hypothetical protein
MSLRCQASKVSGVTMVATLFRRRRPIVLAFAASRRRCASGEPHAPGPELFPEYAVLFLEIVNDLALLLVHPTGKRDENEPPRVG